MRLDAGGEALRIGIAEQILHYCTVLSSMYADSQLPLWSPGTGT